ncbi:zinc ribbon domain-containing protein [Nocardia mangyaensis]|uniref:zinc ribbon domain-containing protein n=1 Tax=Nocardia mangyaensis TaxID=2213200 RepID=UPI002675C4DC|nr:zinc ribbon domain-containing protein [Nocardia mangyaensis]MDO3645827.1 zinc ribbon domain-containing protein [Nocardia mangyaensis]
MGPWSAHWPQSGGPGGSRSTIASSSSCSRPPRDSCAGDLSSAWCPLSVAPWTFRCDRCSTDHTSAFQQNYLSRGRGALRALSNLFGDRIPALYKASHAAESYSNSWGGSASATKDKAFTKAVEEVRGDFRLCAGAARGCALASAGTTTSASAPAARRWLHTRSPAPRGAQIQQAAQRQDCAAQHDLSTPARVTCPTCAAPTTGGRFCATCGTALDLRVRCECGHESPAGAAFCANCGRAQSVT